MRDISIGVDAKMPPHIQRKDSIRILKMLVKFTAILATETRNIFFEIKIKEHAKQ
jgi:hypothetical protein